jgi:hypothetical protein
MLHKCANPDCGTRFRYLGRGKLFQIEMERLQQAAGMGAAPRKRRPLHRVERYWLCDDCASSLTLTFERDGGVSTVPLPQAARRSILTTVQV